MNELTAHTGVWGIATIMVVVASWFSYRYLAPRTWREWASAGLVQAFIIALYAEMYGFPLTVYLMVRFFGLDRAHLDVNLWSTLLDVGPLGMMLSMVAGYVLLFIGIGLFAQGWRELYRARKEKRLATDGLYALVRHPVLAGLTMVTNLPFYSFKDASVRRSVPFPVIVLVYVLLARSEEKRVLAEFGDEYRAYQERVPMFLPRWGQWGQLIGRAKPLSGGQEAPPR